MNKNEFLSALDGFDRTSGSKLYERITLAEKSGIVTYSGEFYPPNVWGRIQNLTSKFDVHISTWGVFDEAERRIMAFHVQDLFYYPVKLMMISNRSKFSNLEHKDYLGALMSLGIRREKMGDLIVKENSCYCAVYEDIFEYVRDNLHTIGKSPCTVEEIIDTDEVPKIMLENKIVVSTSYRVDSVVSAIIGLSRSKAVDLIDGGKVLLNYVEIYEKDRIIHNGDVITIRGYGKFRIDETVGNSGSGRLKLLIKKYI